MTDNSYWFRVLFKLKIYQSSGESFQSFFNDLMIFLYGDKFQTVRPWGREGDGGNDGFLLTDNHYFQLYAPISSRSGSSVDAARKASQDFKKLLENWPNIQKYIFVMNDRFDGVPAPVHKSMEEIRQTYKVDIAVLSARHLEQLFSTLIEEHRMALVGPATTNVTLPEMMDFRMLGELLEHLGNNAGDFHFQQMAEAPDFEDKISLNGLSKHIASILIKASYQISDVANFLNSRPGFEQGIAEEMASIYADSIQAVPSSSEYAADVRFAYILDNILPPSAKTCHPIVRRGWNDVALVVMANYFESCDIYEHPSSFIAP